MYINVHKQHLRSILVSIMSGLVRHSIWKWSDVFALTASWFLLRVEYLRDVEVQKHQRWLRLWQICHIASRERSKIRGIKCSKVVYAGERSQQSCSLNVSPWPHPPFWEENCNLPFLPFGRLCTLPTLAVNVTSTLRGSLNFTFNN